MAWGKGFPRRSGVQNGNQKHKQIASRVFLFGYRSRLLQVCLSLRGSICTILNATRLSAPVTSHARLINVVSPHIAVL